MEFGMSEIESLQEMLGVEEDDGAPQYNLGSALNPATITGKDEGEEVAKPNSKIEFKVNRRNPTGGSSDLPEQPQAAAPKKVDKDRDIWTKEEVNLAQEDVQDDRLQPEFDVLHKQQVGTEDVFLGLSNKDPSSTSCDMMVVKIKLPDTTLKEIQVDTKEQSIQVQTPKYLLNHVLPYPIKKDQGKAKFETDTCTLILDVSI